MTNIRLALCIVIHLVFTQCNSPKNKLYIPTVVFESDALVITQISENTYIHTSYLQTESFGKVDCNGLIVHDNAEVVIIDTPTTDSVSTMLMHWVESTLHSSVKAIIPTHFHNDCLGGLSAFHQHNIDSYASQRTISFAHQADYELPLHSFDEELTLPVGSSSVFAKFFGEGHTRDNVVVYFSKEQVLFGGCLIKEINASKGFLGDANISAWSTTVSQIKATFPDIQVVVPGHGAAGDKALLDYTITLFKD
jgi:metallo-beta-lactamase class B